MGAIEERVYIDHSTDDLNLRLSQMPKGDGRRLAILHELEQREIKDSIQAAERMSKSLVRLTWVLAVLTFGLLLVSIVTLKIIFYQDARAHPNSIQSGKP